MEHLIPALAIQSCSKFGEVNSVWFSGRHATLYLNEAILGC